VKKGKSVLEWSRHKTKSKIAPKVYMCRQVFSDFPEKTNCNFLQGIAIIQESCGQVTIDSLLQQFADNGDEDTLRFLERMDTRVEFNVPVYYRQNWGGQE